MDRRIGRIAAAVFVIVLIAVPFAGLAREVSALNPPGVYGSARFVDASGNDVTATYIGCILNVQVSCSGGGGIDSYFKYTLKNPKGSIVTTDTCSDATWVKTDTHTLVSTDPTGAWTATVTYVVTYPKSTTTLCTDTITVNANKIPTASISPLGTQGPVVEGQVYKVAVTLIGSGSDSDGSIVGYNWRSSLNGQLGTTATFTTSSLSIGTHTIYFKVQDNRGAWSPEVSQQLVVRLCADTDGDGLLDLDEQYVYHSNYLLIDPDGDGLSDYQEVMVTHTDPNHQAHWAIVMCGGTPEWRTDPLDPLGDVAVNEAIQTLIGTGRYTAGSIDYLNVDTMASASGIPVNAAANVANVNAAFGTWLAARSDADDAVMVYFIDHGNVLNHNFVLPDGEISAATVAGLINARSFLKLTFVVEMCDGGNVWTDAIAGVNRITIASSAATEDSLPHGGWSVFGHAFWGIRLPQSGVSIEVAFNEAYSDTVVITGGAQHPVINDQIGLWTNW